VTFTATPANGGTAPTYQWFVNNALQPGNSSSFSTTTLTNGAQVYCTMTSNAQCVNPASATSNTTTITVTALPIPIIVCSNDTILASNYNGTQYFYSWYYNNNFVAISPSLLFQPPGGTYYLVVTSNGCTITSDEVTITICVTATHNSSDEDYFSIYPNPTRDKVTIEAKTKTSDRITITLYNVLGQALHNEEINSTNGDFVSQLNLEEFASGIYLVVISTNNSMKSFKIEKHE